MSLTLPNRADPLAVQAHAALREGILSHELAPGARLSVPAIAEKLGVSRSPAREAIAQIVSEGLAVRQANRGAVVASVSAHDLVEIYRLREVLEGLACRLAATRCTAQHAQILEGLLANHAAAIASDNTTEHYRLDQEFHSAIQAIADNQRLTASLRLLHGQIRIAMHTTQKSSGGMTAAFTEHTAICNAIKAKNPHEAEQAGRQHIARLLAQLEAVAQEESHLPANSKPLEG